MKRKSISGRELATELDASPASISAYVARGLPLTTRERALRWLARNAMGAGWHGGLRGRLSIGERAQRLLAGQPSEPAAPAKRQRAPMPEASMAGDIGDMLADLDGEQYIEALRLEGQRQLLDRIRENAGRLLPEVCRRLELPGYVVEGCVDLLDSILARCGVSPDDPHGPDPLDYEWPAVGPQVENIRRYQARPADDPPAETETDRQIEDLYNRIDELFDAIKVEQAAGQPRTP